MSKNHLNKTGSNYFRVSIILQTIKLLRKGKGTKFQMSVIPEKTSVTDAEKTKNE